jgi:hypothetical protein
MKMAMKVGLAIVAGVVITLITGLLSSTPSGLVGAVWYGYPLNWINRLVIAPTAGNPWVVQWVNLVVDIVVWSIVALIVLMLIGMTRKHK